MNWQFLSDALLTAFPDAQFSLNGDEISSWQHPTQPRPTRAELEILLASFHPTDPDWRGFRLGMFGNSGFQRVCALLPTLTVSGLLLAIDGEEPDVATLAMIWKTALLRLPAQQKPTAAEIEQWNSIAQSCQVPLIFLENGEIHGR